MLILRLERWTFVAATLFTSLPRRKRHDPTKISHLPRLARTQDKKRSDPMPAHRQDLCLMRVQRLGDLTIIGHGINRLLVDLLNHVAFLEIGNTGIRINRSHHNTMNAGRQIQLARELGS